MSERAKVTDAHRRRRAVVYVRQSTLAQVHASYGSVHDFLTNPTYPGAFVFGRTRQHKRRSSDGGVAVRTVELPIEEWPVCLPDHHPGYVSWAEYLATRERLRANVRPRGEGGGAAREGAALLQGLLRCGRCGRRMRVAYSGQGGRSPRYACVRAHHLHAGRVPVARRRAPRRGCRPGLPRGGHAGRHRRERRRRC